MRDGAFWRKQTLLRKRKIDFIKTMRRVSNQWEWMIHINFALKFKKKWYLSGGKKKKMRITGERKLLQCLFEWPFSIIRVRKLVDRRKIHCSLDICLLKAKVLLAIRYTCIHNWPLLPFSQHYDLASYISYVVCILFLCISSGVYIFKWTPTTDFRETFACM